MRIARSTYYDRPAVSSDDTALVERMVAISDGFEAYGYRRIQAALRQHGFVVNHKKLRIDVAAASHGPQNCDA
jgi:putative transposase